MYEIDAAKVEREIQVIISEVRAEQGAALPLLFRFSHLAAGWVGIAAPGARPPDVQHERGLAALRPLEPSATCVSCACTAPACPPARRAQAYDAEGFNSPEAVHETGGHPTEHRMVVVVLNPSKQRMNPAVSHEDGRKAWAGTDVLGEWEA